MDKVEKELRKNIGRNIKLARSKTKFTQERLAEKLQLSSRYISQLERGIAFGSAKTIVNLCKTLNIDSNFLFQDVIDCSTPYSTKYMDDNFVKDYLQLNDYHKTILGYIAKDLLELQKKFSEDEINLPALSLKTLPNLSHFHFSGIANGTSFGESPIWAASGSFSS